MKRKKEKGFTIGLIEKTLIEKAQIEAAEEIGKVIPRFAGCKVTFEYQPTHAWRVSIYKEGETLTDAELDVVSEIAHRSRGPLRRLMYGDS